MLTTRRHFLQRAAGAVGLASLPALAVTPAEDPLSLGFSLYGMKTLLLERALSECARIGYRNVELALMTGFPTDPAKLTPDFRASVRRQLRAAGLPVSSLIVNLSLAGDAKGQAAVLETLRLAAMFAAEIDPANPPVIQTVLGGKPAEWDEKKAQMAERLRAWDAAAAERGVTVAIKAHVSSAVNSPDRLLWLFQQAAGRNVALAYDYSHFALAGLTLEESLRPLAPHTKFVHVKDGRMEGKEVRFLLPGEGHTDFAHYFRLLRQSGYRGAVVVEVSAQISNRPGYDPIAAAERSYAALSRI